MWVEIRDMAHRSGLLARRGRRYVTIVASLDICDGIVLGGRGLMVLQTERPKQPDMQGTFLLLHLLTKVAFKLDASYSFILHHV